MCQKFIIARIISGLQRNQRGRNMAKESNNNKKKKPANQQNQPHREIIMIDRLQSKTIVNEYLKMIE